MRTVRSHREMWSATSSKAFSKVINNDDAVEISDISSEITSFIFEELLPVVCAKYMCEVDVIVTKELLKDDTTSRSKKSEAYLRSKKTSVDAQPVSKKVSSRDTCTTKGESFILCPSLETPGTVNIKAFYDHNNLLKEISMSKLGKIPDIVVRSITLVAPLYEHLTRFTIRNSRVDGLTLNELHKVLSLTTLSEICLDDSRLPHGQVSILLDKETHLKYLSLARCQMSDDICIEIVSKLHFQSPAEKKLTVLNLSSNRLTNKSAEAIGEMLRTNRHLRYLNISGNFISDDGAKSIFGKLVEFSLTSEEILAKRFRVFDNLKRRKEILAQFVSALELNNSGVEGKQSEMRNKKSGLMLLKNAKTQTKEKADMDPATRMARAHFLADQMMAQISDPFSNNNIVSRNGWLHCIGNFSLYCINISYNHLTYYTLKMVSDVMNYQNTYRMNVYSKHDTASSKRTDLQGLIKIVLEGNELPEIAQEYTIINMLSNKALMYFNDASAGGSRRSRVKTNISMGRP